jgi:Leucine-rich repeat (LRR) protein
LPENLPDGLQFLSCSYNNLTSLPDYLPDGLQRLWCNYNTLTSLPNNLPDCLQEIRCGKISMYPNLARLPTIQEKILYIQKVNNEIGVEKCKQWLKIVNEKNIFLEKYMMNCCHPKNLNIKESIEIDKYLDKFIENL